jgi:hypothetical protein
VLQREGAALGDLARGADPLRVVGEALEHLAARAQVALGVRREPAPGRVEARLPAQAGERVQQPAIFGPGVAHVVAGGQRHARGLGQGGGAAARALARPGERAADVDPHAPLRQQRSGAVEQLGREGGVAARQGGEVGGVLLQFLPADPRLLLAAARVPAGQQAREVAVAARRLGQQQQGAAGPGIRGIGGGLGDADLRAHEGAQPRGGGGPVEARRPVEATAVGQGQGRVVELGGARHQVFGVGGGFEEREGAAAA